MFDTGVFTQSFMIHAWESGTAIAILSAFVGFFIVLKSDSFVAHALPQAGFSGGAAAVFFGLNPYIGLLIFSLGGAVLIGKIEDERKNDIATTLTLISTLGIGMLLISLTNQYAEKAYALLFGQIVGVSANQVLVTVSTSAVCLLFLLMIWRPLLFGAVSKEVAESKGIPVRLVNILFLIIVALATTVIVPVVGALLAFSLIIMPSAGSIYLSSNPKYVLLLSIISSILVFWLSILLGYFSGWPIGFFVSAVGMLWYLFARSYQLLKNKWKHIIS
ncbi:MAG: metal ABC transporter permease [Lactococcus plantarum]|nr:metal ABC transporter permease [Lactococcus plantarum]MDN6084970.1 metal ABC transporter permease [Lactococcus plantarum]